MGEGHIGLVEYVSSLYEPLYANTKYSPRQIFGSLPRNVDDEDLVDPQVSSLNLLKAQRARKAANATQRANQKDHASGKRTADSTQRSHTPERSGLSQSPSPQRPHTPDSERLSFPQSPLASPRFENSEPSASARPSSSSISLRYGTTANGGAFGSSLPRSSISTSQHPQAPPSSEPHQGRLPLNPVQPSDPGRRPLPHLVQESQPSRKQLPQPPSGSSLTLHPGRRPQAKVLPPAHRVRVDVLISIIFHIFL